MRGARGVCRGGGEGGGGECRCGQAACEKKYQRDSRKNLRIERGFTSVTRVMLLARVTLTLLTKQACRPPDPQDASPRLHLVVIPCVLYNLVVSNVVCIELRETRRGTPTSPPPPWAPRLPRGSLRPLILRFASLDVIGRLHRRYMYVSYKWFA